MSRLKNTLAHWAKTILFQVKDFEIEECVTMQYGDGATWNIIFASISNSKDWEKIRKDFALRTDREAQYKMIDLLNEQIELQYARNYNNATNSKIIVI